jgi:proteasome lid subunit RPN8/RPN11
MLFLPNHLLEQINEHVEKAYPEEGAGFLIGENGEVKEIVALSNAREDGSRHPRTICRPN